MMKNNGPSIVPWDSTIYCTRIRFITVYLNPLFPKPRFNPIIDLTIYLVGLYFCQQSLVRHLVKRFAEI